MYIKKNLFWLTVHYQLTPPWFGACSKAAHDCGSAWQNKSIYRTKEERRQGMDQGLTISFKDILAVTQALPSKDSTTSNSAMLRSSMGLWEYLASVLQYWHRLGFKKNAVQFSVMIITQPWFWKQPEILAQTSFYSIKKRLVGAKLG